MTNIGRPVPNFRAPALVGGNLLLLDSARLQGHCFILCFLPPLGLRERTVLERHVQDFVEEQDFFLGVVDEGALFFGPWQRDLWPKGLTLTADPLGRLSRSFGVSRHPASTRCQSFVIDKDGRLRCHLVHDLNGRGMGALLEIMKACRSGKTPQSDVPRSVIQDMDERAHPPLGHTHIRRMSERIYGSRSYAGKD